MDLKLSVLDQSPVPEGMSAEEALYNTVKLAQHVEKLGFHRFWVSEHHDSDRLSGSSPEVMISFIAAKTEKMKIGSGGVMLPHYSSYKVAENFKVLEGLNPGRIDVGIGRAPGGMPTATMALQEGKWSQVDRYPEQIDDLLGYLHNDLDESHRFYGLRASPNIKTAPELWILGSSPSSATLAAEKGLPYAFAKFINGEADDYYTSLYRSRFVPSKYLSRPKNIVATFVICAETEAEANRLASSQDLSLLWNEQGKRVSTPSPEIAASYPYTSYEKARILENRKRMIVGTPEQVKEQLIELSKKHETDEMMLVTITHDFQAKLKSFDLIANAIFES